MSYNSSGPVRGAVRELVGSDMGTNLQMVPNMQPSKHPVYMHTCAGPLMVTNHSLHRPLSVQATQ